LPVFTATTFSFSLYSIHTCCFRNFPITFHGVPLAVLLSTRLLSLQISKWLLPSNVQMLPSDEAYMTSGFKTTSLPHPWHTTYFFFLAVIDFYFEIFWSQQAILKW
jgi:hypothetical protein